MAIEKKKEKKAAPAAMPQTAEEKKKAIDTAIAQIEKQYGAGAVMRLGATKAMNVDLNDERPPDSQYSRHFGRGNRHRAKAMSSCSNSS